ncbi:PREDICTED: testican-1-like [Fulmarus glacialis]|uniref:testican-1-like n=1 Tax=Fulmarus glacialis TaxID=30455 RepID=UPI00051BAEA9|nr:PREDICTED: testican-1-like [Fulmarus glacialis]
MSGVLVIAAWCFLQVESRHPEIITSTSNHGNFLDNDKWLSTVSQYDKDKYWNKFRDVSTSSFTAYFLFVPFDRSILSSWGCWLLEECGWKRDAAWATGCCLYEGCSELFGSWTDSPGIIN